MAILTGKKIQQEVEAGRIYISDFDPKRLGPNSYNLRLGDKLKFYNIQYLKQQNEHWFLDACLDPKQNNPLMEIDIAPRKLLMPGQGYLGMTQEVTGTDFYVPRIEGRSSVGRLFINVHSTAGFGDIGFRGHWTLEISVVEPVYIYPGMEICQIYFETVEGEIELYNGS